MPPPLGEVSDDESTGASIPYNDAEERDVKTAEDKDNASGDEDEEDDEDDEGVYVVEQIMGHDFINGSLFMAVKWKGYDDPADQTMEPEENLMEGAKELVEDYYQKIGGRPEEEKSQPQKRKRKSTGPAKAKKEPTEPKKRVKSEPAADSPADTSVNNTPSLTETSAIEDEAPWMPKGSWEKALVCVETIVRDPETQNLLAYLHWRNGKKSKAEVKKCYDKCPKKMLEFYEKHLVFKEG